jgi:hypothetical protein
VALQGMHENEMVDRSARGKKSVSLCLMSDDEASECHCVVRAAAE